MASLNIKSALADTYKKRQETLSRVYDDPFIGYDTIQDAEGDCSASSQAEVLARLLNRENLFISGPAGSGKTTIIKRFIDFIDAAYNGNFRIEITASTGMAASLLGGRTIHSWSGLGIFDGKFDPKRLREDGIRLFKSRDDILYCDTLIIDEISMLPAYYLDNLDAIMKYARRSDEPFGGVQVVFLGDFMQLPPVPSRHPKPDMNYGYAITSQAWSAADVHYCYLDKVHRASDEDLKHLLKSVEKAKIDDAARKTLERCSHHVREDGKSYTTLFTMNKNVDQYNDAELKKTPGRSRIYRARAVQGTERDIEALYRSNGIPKQVELKIGATVIFTSNIYDPSMTLQAANGNVGRVVSMGDYSVVVRLNNGNEVFAKFKNVSTTEKKQVKLPSGKVNVIDVVKAEVSYLPLKLGYAITVHKSQGQSFDGVEVDLSNCFTPGLGYVALSRVRSSDNLIISGLNDKALEVDEQSLRITNIVKHGSLRSRKEFMDNIDFYADLLTNQLSLDVMWDEEYSGMERSRKALSNNRI